MVQTRSGARRARTESFGYQTPFLVSREFERYERKFMIALQSVDFSPLHMAMKLVGQCCSGEVLVLYFAVLYWVVDQRYVFFFRFSLFSNVVPTHDTTSLPELVWTQFGWFLWRRFSVDCWNGISRNLDLDGSIRLWLFVPTVTSTVFPPRTRE